MALTKKTHQDSPEENKIYTIGHSNKQIEDFIRLLKLYDINAVVDVRSNPYSKYASQFNQKSLQRALRDHDIKYIFMGNELGGQPKDSRFYDDKGFVLYYRIADEPDFKAGIERLKKGLKDYKVAIMCSEENPKDCHRRRLVSWVLIKQNIDIYHIRANGNLQAESADSVEINSEQLSIYESGVLYKWKSIQPVLQEKRHRNSSESLRKTGSS